MHRSSKVAIVGAGIATPILLGACASIFGITGGNVEDASVDGQVDASTDAPIDVPYDYVMFDQVSFDVNTAICDGAVATVDPSMASWVSANGNDNNPCTQAMPCQTLGYVLSHSPKHYIYLDNSTFTESLVLDGSFTNFTIQGGWVLDGSVWTDQCLSTLTTIQEPADGGLSAVDLVGASGITFRLLSIWSKVQGQGGSGDSVYAMRVMGTTNVTLDNVTLVAQNGAQGAYNGNGATNLGCTTTSSGNGMSGNEGNAINGVWTNSGYAPQQAEAGQPGDLGTATGGTPGACGWCGQ